MAPKKDYTPEQMGQAIEAVRQGEKIATAAKRFGVPRITLYNKISGKSPLECAMGPQTVLLKSEEDILVKWLIAMSEKHFPVNRELLMESVQKIIVDQGRPNPFTNNKPGKKWFQSFLKRHPDIIEKTAQNLTKSRDDVCEEDLRKWFSEIDLYLDQKGLKDILQNPSRVFNTDESAFFLSPKAGRVLCKRGEKHLYNFCGDEKENLTVLVTANAAGQLAPPMIVFKYERIPAHISASVPGDWGIGKSESGWMCGSTFYEFITNIFDPWLQQENIQKPVLFFLDGHKSHLTLHLSNYCSENGIEIIALYPNSTHILQPMDVSVFRPLKVAWRKEVSRWQLDHLGHTLKKENFAPVLQKSLATISKDCIQNGFRAGGLYPFGPDYIDMSKIKNKNVTQKEHNSKQTEFMKYLDLEIVKVFSPQKLELFNKMYYKDRDTLQQILHPEDESLYVIWAKNKHLSQSAIQVDPTSQTDSVAASNEVQPSTSNTGNIKASSQINEKSTDDRICSTPQELPLETVSGEDIQYSQSVAQVDPTSQTDSVAVAASNEVQPSTSDTGNIKASSQINEKSTDDHICSTPQELPLETVSGEDIQYSQSVAQVAPTSQTNSEAFNEVQPSTSDTGNVIASSQITENSTDVRTRSTPQKHPLETVLGVVIPSPFKNNLFWPEEDIKEKKKRKREKVPYAVTSNVWQAYHIKKSAEKRKQIEEKEKRAKERQAKKILKEINIKEKNKVNKKKTYKEKDDTSDDTDLEIPYAESDNSYNELQDNDSAEENEERSNPVQVSRRKSCGSTQMGRKTKRIRKGSNQGSFKSDTESDDKPISQLKVSSNPVFKTGHFVIVKYEGEYFPGKIEATDENQYEISTMVLSTGNSFRWPDKPDKIWYNRMSIVESINDPSPLNKRGFFKIKEMEKYLPDLYL